MQAQSRFDEASSLALRRALVLGVLVAVAVGIVASILVSIIVGVVILVVSSVGWVLWVQAAFGAAMERVLAPLGLPVTTDDEPGFHNALEGVAILTGVIAPDVRVLDSASANAMVAADSESSTVVVTTGLLDGVRTVEQEALAAELACRVRDGSARFGTLVAGLPPVLGWVAGLTPHSVAATLGAQRATLVDFDAVSITRYPPGLISAFEQMDAQGTAVDVASASSAPLWIAPAVGPQSGVDRAVDHTANQRLDYRISVLREL